jgi:DNA-binding GntR family transcriptional regulator
MTLRPPSPRRPSRAASGTTATGATPKRSARSAHSAANASSAKNARSTRPHVAKPATTAKRSPLRANVAETVLARILSGALAPGSRITESRLAEELGVSRTPLREALFQLERDGFVHADLARGFTVAPLDPREVRELYPVLESLEVLALRTLGTLAAAAVPELERINDQLAAAAGDASRGLALDARWHATLLARCPNERLLALIAQLKRSVSRYERIYMRDAALARASVAQHRAVIQALAAGDLDGAVRALERNWRFGLDALLVRLGEP